MAHRSARHTLLAALVTVLVLSGCADDAEQTSAAPAASPETSPAVSPVTSTGSPTGSSIVAEQRHPDVIGAEAERTDDGTWTIRATLSSPYDTPERYADAWRVLGPDGTEYAVRVLLHDHASEQPFTRSQSGVTIPADVDVVTIEGRDLVHGWGGATFELELPGA